MGDRELSNKLSSGELTNIKLGGTGSDRLVVVQASLNSTNAQVETNKNNIDSNSLAITALQELHTVAAISIASSVKLPQTLTPDTAEVLEYMTDVLVDDGGTSISYDIDSNSILIQEAATYRVYGTVNIVAPINDIIDIELYIDNLPTGFISTAIGRGSVTTIGFNSSFLKAFAANDDVHLYIKSSGSTATLQSASMNVERTAY